MDAKTEKCYIDKKDYPLEKLIKKESKDLGALEDEIIEKVNSNKILSENIEPEINDTLTIA